MGKLPKTVGAGKLSAQSASGPSRSLVTHAAIGFPFLRSHPDVRLAILAVPSASAHEVGNRLVAAGISAILNFAPVILQVPDEVVVSNVNLAIELENLAYFGRP